MALGVGVTLEYKVCVPFFPQKPLRLFPAVSHIQNSYCEPCSQCTIDPDTTEMKCDCEYSDESRDHETQLLLSMFFLFFFCVDLLPDHKYEADKQNAGDHVYNQDGLLSCLNVQGDADLNYSAVTTTASSK